MNTIKSHEEIIDMIFVEFVIRGGDKCEGYHILRFVHLLLIIVSVALP